MSFLSGGQLSTDKLVLQFVHIFIVLFPVWAGIKERPALLINLVRGRCHFFLDVGTGLHGVGSPHIEHPCLSNPSIFYIAPQAEFLFFLKCEVQNAPKLNIWQSQRNPSVDISRTAMTKLFCLKFSSLQING